MPLFLEIVIGFLTVCFGAAAIFAGVGYYKQGAKSEILDEGNTKLNTNSLLKDQIDALEGKVNLQTEQMEAQAHEIQDLNKKIDQLTLDIEERDKKFAQVVLTLKGENPMMAEFVKAANEYMLLSKPVMEDLRDFLKKQIL